MSSQNEHGPGPAAGEALQEAAPGVVSGGTTVTDETAVPEDLVWDDGLIARRAAAQRPEQAAPEEASSQPTVPAAAEPVDDTLFQPEPQDGGTQPSCPAEDSDEPAESVAQLLPGQAQEDGHGGADLLPVQEPEETEPADEQTSEPGQAPVAEPDGTPSADPGTGSSVADAAADPVTGCGTDLGNPELRQRLGALRELIGLSSTRLDGAVLAEAGRVLDEAGARGKLPGTCTTVAIAGATGSGKSTLFNALAGEQLSDAGTNRPTTAAPVACSWARAGSAGGAERLLDRLGVERSARRQVDAADLEGLVLIDLPDHDAAADGHREQVDRLLELVDAVVWVVDPEKYADAVLHERYLRPLAGYAEVTFVVLNQTDRLPGDAAHVVLDDLRRLLDEDGMAVGEHGEPGARVLALSALTGAGVDELRAELGAFVTAAQAPALRLSADLDGAVERLREVYSDPVHGPGGYGSVGLTDAARDEFEDRLASAVGAKAAGLATERAWLRHAESCCGTLWTQLAHWRDLRRFRQGAAGDPAADRPGADAAGTDPDERPESRPRVARHVVAQAVRELSETASEGLPEAWRRAVRDTARRGGDRLPEALDQVVRVREEGVAAQVRDGVAPARRSGTDGTKPQRPAWWSVATVAQGLLVSIQLLGLAWLVGAGTGLAADAGWLPAAMLMGGVVAGSVLAWLCRAASRGPARKYGRQEESQLRRLAEECGRSHVLDPVAAELMRYREVREQYVIATGGPGRY